MVVEEEDAVGHGDGAEGAEVEEEGAVADEEGRGGVDEEEGGIDAAEVTETEAAGFEELAPADGFGGGCAVGEDFEDLVDLVSDDGGGLRGD